MRKRASSTHSFSLPVQLRRHVEKCVAAGAYRSASELVEEAVREKLARETDKRNSGLRKTRKKVPASVAQPIPPRPSVKALRVMKQLAKEDRIPQRWLDNAVDPTVE